ncbi:rod shape-determining protein MreD [Peptoniphilaceae bacterium SGI.131]
MNSIKIILLFIFSMIMDLVVLPKYLIFGVTVSVSIPLLIILSMRAKNENITYFAILLGLIRDINFTSVLGISALSYYLISFYSFKRNEYKKNDFSLGLLMLILSVLFNFIFVSSLRMIARTSFSVTSLKNYFLGPIFVELILSAIIFTAFYFIDNRIRHRKSKQYYL